MKEGAFKYNTAITGKGENSFSAQTYTVLSFLKKFNIKNADLFKMDIEGAEEKIFAGDISWLKNISEIIIEFHSRVFKANCFEKLKSENFSYVPHGTRLCTEVFHFVH